MKSTLKILIVLIPIIKESFESTIEIKGSPPFCYEEFDCGPGSVRWSGICKSGENQSPIDLLHNFKTMRLAEENPRKLHFNREYHTKHFYIRNNGHSIQISFHSNLTSNAEMSGYGFDYPYIFAQAHFHWGHDIRHGGSEHTINGAHLPVEIHFVHYDSKFPSFEDAVASGDARALSVLAVFLEPVHEPDFFDNDAFRTIAHNLPLRYQDKAVLVNLPLNLRSLLPYSGETFYRYLGSLTTPTCNEEVEWTVVPEPVKISIGNYKKFHEVKDENGDQLGQNYRPVQALGNRKIQVYRSI